MSKPRLCVIAFKEARSTIHVLRQIQFLSRDFDLTLIAHGTPDPSWPPLTWHAIPEASLLSKLARLLMYALGRVFPVAYDLWYWHSRRFAEAYQYALASGAEAIHANDWQALPIAVEVARRTGARVVFHQHEYAELEREDSAVWRLLVSPALRRLLVRYTHDPRVRIDRSITVCTPIAERYRRELGIDPVVVYNAPVRATTLAAAHETDPHRIRLVHHGYAQRGRGIDRMIEAVAMADRRFTLDLMLMSDDPAHIQELKQLAARLAPERITFRPPVRPLDIVQTVAEYDMGLCVIQPSTYNTLMMLPNKFFEYIQAGLAVCVGPSPAMVDIVERYGVGVRTAGFEPPQIAATLNALTLEQITGWKAAARQAATTLNADVEMGKIVSLYRDLLADAG
jgi:hypothetical protein